MWERLSLPVDQIPQLRRHYFETYGTTLRGLQIHYQVDADDYLAYVHDLPLASYIQPEPSLHELILSLPQQKWIFTNADDRHAQRVLAQLELADCFKGIIDIRSTNFCCKPEKEAYLRALSIAGETEPSNCVFLDDSPRNLAPARELGFVTVLVGTQQTDPAAVYSVLRLQDLPRVLPGLWARD